MNAPSLLKECNAILTERGEQYGDAKDLYDITSKLVSGQVGSRFWGVSPAEVCLIMAQIKMGRIANGNTQKDTYIDAINYIALAAELSDFD